MKTQPTIFHVTHQKAGSQWIAEVLKYCAPERIVLPKFNLTHFRNKSIKVGKIYLTTYVPAIEFEAVLSIKFTPWSFRYFMTHPIQYVTNWYHFQLQQNPYIVFVILRDLRDTLISLYFGYKINHPLYYKHRTFLNSVNQEQGLLFLLEKELHYIADIQLSWLNKNHLILKYEEFLKNEYAGFEKIVDYCQIRISRKQLHEIVRYNSFEMITGRKRGAEDVTAHQRKGIAGDWRNHFSERIKKEFKRRFGNVLIRTGYERDYNW